MRETSSIWLKKKRVETILVGRFHMYRSLSKTGPLGFRQGK